MKHVSKLVLTILLSLILSFNFFTPITMASAEDRNNQTIHLKFAKPNNQSELYIDLTESLSKKKQRLNTVIQDLKTIEVTGHHLILNANSSGGYNLYEKIVGNRLEPRTDLELLRLSAFRIDVIGHVRFPHTNLSIATSELNFFDQTGQFSKIDTTPLGYDTRAADSVGEEPASNGLNGEEGPWLEVAARRITTPGAFGDGPRFIADGGPGQQPGHGQKGRKGNSVPPISCSRFYSWMPCDCIMRNGDRKPPSTDNVILLFSNKIAEARRGQDAWPGNGAPGVASGVPGRGGKGGEGWATNPKHLELFSAVGGKSADAGPNFPGGEPGGPNPAYKVSHNGCKIIGVQYSNTQIKGADAPAPKAEFAIGPNGLVDVFDKISWLSPAAVDSALKYAKDLYRSGATDEAIELLKKIEFELENPELQEKTWGYPSNFAIHREASLLEIQSLIDQATNNLDYYGNPNGWVPTFSLEVLMTVYKDEIESTIRNLFLFQQIHNRMTNNRFETNDIKIVSDGIRSDLNKLKSSLKKIIREINLLTERSALIGKSAETYEAIMASEEEILRINAASIARSRRDEFSNLKKVFLLIQTASSVAKSMKGVSFNDTAVEIVNNIDSLFDGTDWSETERTTEAIQKVSASLKEADAVRRSIPNLSGIDNETEELLEQLKANSAYYQNLVAELNRLVAEYRSIKDDIDRLNKDFSHINATIASKIASNYALVSKLPAKVQYANATALSTIAKIRNDYEERLLYYQYQMFLAFQFRFLEPFNERYSLKETYQAFSRILATNANGELIDLSVDQSRSLMSILEADIRRIVSSSVNAVNSRPPQKDGFIEYFLSVDELVKLNSGEAVTLNPKIKKLLFDGEENQRVRAVRVKSLELEDLSSDDQYGVLKIVIQHPGRSEVTARGGLYHFTHGQNGISPFQWVISKSLSDIGLVLETASSNSSEFTSLLNIGSSRSVVLGESRKYTLPGLIADYEISVRKSGPADAKIENLGLIFDYRYSDTITGE